MITLLIIIRILNKNIHYKAHSTVMKIALLNLIQFDMYMLGQVCVKVLEPQNEYAFNIYMCVCVCV